MESQLKVKKLNRLIKDSNNIFLDVSPSNFDKRWLHFYYSMGKNLYKTNLRSGQSSRLPLKTGYRKVLTGNILATVQIIQQSDDQRQRRIFLSLFNGLTLKKLLSYDISKI